MFRSTLYFYYDLATSYLNMVSTSALILARTDYATCCVFLDWCYHRFAAYLVNYLAVPAPLHVMALLVSKLSCQFMSTTHKSCGCTVLITLHNCYALCHLSWET